MPSEGGLDRNSAKRPIKIEYSSGPSWYQGQTVKRVKYTFEENAFEYEETIEYGLHELMESRLDSYEKKTAFTFKSRAFQEVLEGVFPPLKSAVEHETNHICDGPVEEITIRYDDGTEENVVRCYWVLPRRNISRLLQGKIPEKAFRTIFSAGDD